MRATAALSFALLVLGAACAAPPPPKTTPDEVPIKPGSAADACLARASAKREKRPNEPASIGVKHILVRYAGAKNADAGVKRSREDACLRANEALEKLHHEIEWDAVVKEYSEEAGASTRSGTLGTIERKDVLPPFADAAFELDPNQVSDVVETDRGFHIILRTQ